MLTEGDLAKYPFMPEAAEYVKRLDVSIEDLTRPEFREILERAERRVEEAILSGLISGASPKDAVEILSFPIAVMMVAAADNIYMKRRYALAEAKRASELLRREREEILLEVARSFHWRIRRVDASAGPPTYEFALHFVDYLRNAIKIQGQKWKLVNRLLVRGEVYLTKAEVSRLLEEEVRRHVEQKLDIKVGLLPGELMQRVTRLKQLFLETRGKREWEPLPTETSPSAFPPCMKALYEAASSGRRLSHVGRFALTSFLLNIGMPVEEVVDLFRSVPDFNERMTRYQVEHIAGGRGSHTRYVPPKCDTMRTHGLCPGMDDLCRRVRHPLTYYRRKLRQAEMKVRGQRK